MSSFIEIKQIGKHILLLCLYKRKIKENKLTKKKLKKIKRQEKIEMKSVKNISKNKDKIQF